MKLEGGCYCGALRYVAEGEPAMKAECHCRECQYITGGAPDLCIRGDADSRIQLHQGNAQEVHPQRPSAACN